MTVSHMSAGVMHDLSVLARAESNPLHVSRFQTLSALDEAARDWDAVQDRCPFHHVLLDHRWVRAWWNVFGGNKELHGLVIRREGRPIGLAPLIYSQGHEAWPRRDGQLQIAEDARNLTIPKWQRLIPVRRVTLPLNIASYNSRSHILIAEDEASVCAAILDYWMEKSRTWDVMVLDGLPEASRQRETFLAAAASRGLLTLPHGRVREMYSADLTGGVGEYLARRGSHFRKRYKAQIRSCERAGRLDLTMYRGSDIGRGLDILFQIERDTWKAKPDANAPVKIAIDGQIRQFFSEVAFAYAEQDEAVIHVMSLDGQPVGALFGLSRQSVILSLAIYLRDEMRDVLNAAPLWKALIEDATARGMTKLDIHGVTPYARKWATSADHYRRLYIFSPHVRGRMLWATKALATTVSHRLAERRTSTKRDEDGRN